MQRNRAKSGAAGEASREIQQRILLDKIEIAYENKKIQSTLLK